MIKNKTKGFTLIELLTVIAIVGLLSSIVLVSVKSAKQRAEEKKNMQFSASIQHSIGGYPIAIWKFEDNLNDSSGRGNDGVWVGTPSYVTGIIGKAIKTTDGSHVEIPDRETLNSKSGAITLEFWAYLERTGFVELVSDYWGESFGCYIDPYFNANLYCGVIDINDGSASFYLENPLETRRWHHIVLTYDGKGTAKMYLDAIEIEGESYFLSDAIYNGEDLVFGSTGEDMDILIDEVRLYDSYITISEVQKHYAEDLVKIGLAEYNNKTNKNHSLNSFSL